MPVEGVWAEAGKDVQLLNGTTHAIASHDKVVRGTETSFMIKPRDVEAPGRLLPLQLHRRPIVTNLRRSTIKPIVEIGTKPAA